MQSEKSRPFQPLTAMGIVARSLELFREHLGPFLAISVGPVFLLGTLDLLIEHQHWLTQLLFIIPTLFVYLLAWSATTLLTAGALLGHVPDFATAYRCALRSPLGTLLKASLAMILLIMAGFIALIVPGFIVMAQLLLVPAVVVIERRRTWDSLRRSRALGSGFHARNLGIVILLSLPPTLAFWLSRYLGIEGFLPDLVLNAVSSALQALSMLATVLIYVDMRARKESLDPVTFALEINAAYGSHDPA
jgi:hypothetical protein